MAIDLKSYAMGRASAGGGPVPVEPTLQDKTVTPTAQQQTVEADNGYDGLGTVTVNGDPNLLAENIKKDIEIFSITGSYEGSGGEPNLQQKSVNVNNTGSTVVEPDAGYDGLSKVNITGSKVQPFKGVTGWPGQTTIIPDFSNLGFVDISPDSGYQAMAIVEVTKDSTLIPSNVKKGIVVHGITGTYEGGGSTPTLQNKTVTPSNQQQTVQPDSGYDGLSSVVVNTDANLISGNIKQGVSIFGVSGSYTPNLQNKSVSPTTSQQVIEADQGYDGLDEVTVGAIALQSKTATPSASQQTIQPDQGYDGLSSVVVNTDQNLTASNIKKDVSIFGVTGTYEGSGGGGIQAPAKGFMPTEWDSDGFITKGVLNGMTDIPAYFMAGSSGQSGTYRNAYEMISELTLDTVPEEIGTEYTAGATTGYSFRYLYNLKLKFPGQSTASGAVVFPEGVKKIFQSCFEGNKANTSLDFPSTLTVLNNNSFKANTNITTVKFRGTPTTLGTSAFSGCTGITRIDVPWAEGAKNGAPWGATNATINYNVTT